ncbi:hypothetical protein OG21DRAFT_1564865 [Imleria badia]|nr:hypothetical protein OG21DRAFT_1564865 [Imleria badia]
MNQLSLVCLSLTPNLRCVGFTLGQSEALIIPPAIEVILSLFFIYLWAQVLLAADGILYFIWALLDMLSHVVPAARISLAVFSALDFLVGAVSFTPILLYSIYLYRLSFRDFIPTLPRKLQPYLEILLPILLVIAVAMNEVSSFVGTHLGTAPNRPLVVVQFSHNSESLWRSLSWSSLTIYTIVQFLFFLLAFSRLSRAFLDQRRIELADADEHHYFNGIAWITAGVVIGVIETIAGFAQVSFGVALARRILRLIARATLMLGLLKGLDVAENFENLAGELRGVSRINRISRMLGVNPQRNMFRRISQSYTESSRVDECSTVEKHSRDQRVTVRYEKGQAPSLQIRFSALDFPAHGTLADMAQQRRRSFPGLIPGHAGAGTSTQQYGESDVSDEMAAVRNAMLETPRAKSALVTTGNDHHGLPDWIRPPEKIHTRQGSGGTVSDSLSIVRDLERKFPSLPPRVTGKYRGSVLGQNYEEDPFPVVGVSRQSSLRQDGGAHNPSEEGVASVTLSPSGSIKRKPAPPLLENIGYISDRHKRPASTWGGLTDNKVNYPAHSPVVPNSPRKGATVSSADPAPLGEPSTPRSRRTTARDVIKRASRALSDASIRSAEWLASASSPRSARTPLTVTDIEMYRRGTLGPVSARPVSGVGEGLPGEKLLPKASRRSADETRTPSKPSQPRNSVGI